MLRRHLLTMATAALLAVGACSDPPPAQVQYVNRYVDRPARARIPLHWDGYAHRIKVAVNQQLNVIFIIDSGANVVAINPELASILVNGGTLTTSDVHGVIGVGGVGGTTKGLMITLRSMA